MRAGFVLALVEELRRRDVRSGSVLDVGSLLSGEGATVLETSRRDEIAKLAALGIYDVVIAMAVIEHIPHTPPTEWRGAFRR